MQQDKFHLLFGDMAVVDTSQADKSSMKRKTDEKLNRKRNQ